jgi:hypothetical protein
MQCINCGSQLEPNWTHCPHCGKFKSVLKETVTSEDVDSIFGKMMGPSQKACDAEAKDAKAFNAGAYGSGVRGQVFEVIVRQAMAGAPWRQICEGPMAVNKITAEEVMAEVDRRRKMNGPSEFKRAKEEKAKMDSDFKKSKKSASSKESKGVNIHNIDEARSFFPSHDSDDKPSTPPRPQPPATKPELINTATQRLQKLYKQLEEFLDNAIKDKDQKEESDRMVAELNEIINSVMRLETLLYSIQNDIAVSRDLEREIGRTRKHFDSEQPGDPHRIDW